MSLKKYLKFFLCFFFFLCSVNFNIEAGHYIEGETRISLNKPWKFKIDPRVEGEQNKWYSVSHSDKDWGNISVPGSWELINEYANYIGKAWYRTSFDLPVIHKKRVYVEFGAVSMSYSVFVNNTLINKEICGNYKERYDITDFIREKNNIIAVEVDNSLSWGAYCNWGGIRRPVYISILDPIHIERQAITSIPNLKTGTTEINIDVHIKNTSNISSKISCSNTIRFDDHVVGKVKTQECKINANSDTIIAFKIKLNKAQTKLWHFDDPNLYTSEVNLFFNGEKVSAFIDRFGIRKIELDGNQFKLNGEPVKLTGFNWVADDRYTGNALPEWRYKEDIDRMKESGANLARLSHRPLPEEVMDYLDEKGLMSISEFNIWSQYLYKDSPESQSFARKLIQQQFNHPSVIGWSVGNEMGNKHQNPQVNEYVKSIIAYVKQNIDSTRIVAYVSHTADYQIDDAAKYGDMIWINKYSNYEKGIDNLIKTYPQKAILITEYGGYGIESGNLIYDTPNNTEYKTLIVDKLADRKELSGWAIWTFNDYRSRHQSLNPLSATPLHQNRQWGIVDVYRNKKRAYSQIKNFYGPIRKLEVNNKIDNSTVSTEISLSARSQMDIPAFTLKGYRLIWEVKTIEGQTSQGGSYNLPVVDPNSNTITYNFDWVKNEKDALLKVTLLSPTEYNVNDTIINLLLPPKPDKINYIHAGRSIRVFIDKNEFTNEFFLQYSMKGKTIKTLPTIDHYIDLTSLPYDESCNISLVGMNGKGVSEVSIPINIVSTNDAENLPPVIWGYETYRNGLKIGIGYIFTDTYYEVRYGTSLANRDDWKKRTIRNFGILDIDNLQNGQKYYVQIRSANQWNVHRSLWSETIEVVINERPLQGSAKINGIFRSANETIVSITPVKNASYYILNYTDNNKKVTTRINRSEIYYHVIKNRNIDNIQITAY